MTEYPYIKCECGHETHIPHTDVEMMLRCENCSKLVYEQHPKSKSATFYYDFYAIDFKYPFEDINISVTTSTAGTVTIKGDDNDS